MSWPPPRRAPTGRRPSPTKRSSRWTWRTIKAGDIVGIGIHTGNALRGYEVGTAARRAGATVIYGGIHATLYPDEARDLGGRTPW